MLVDSLLALLDFFEVAFGGPDVEVVQVLLGLQCVTVGVFSRPLKSCRRNFLYPHFQRASKLRSRVNNLQQRESSLNLIFDSPAFGYLLEQLLLLRLNTSRCIFDRLILRKVLFADSRGCEQCVEARFMAGRRI